MNLTRRSLQTLAMQRIEEAKLLYEAEFWPGAYYLAGYSVECALKACIVKTRRKHEIPFSPPDATRVYTHNLRQLRDDTGIAPLDDPGLIAKWALVKDWSETSRYREDTTDAMAGDLIGAIDGRKGVLAWLRKHW